MNRNKIIAILLLTIVSSVGCNKVLDKKPHNITPQTFFKTQTQVESYSIARYGLLSAAEGYTMGPGVVNDTGTDNQTSNAQNPIWRKGEIKVPSRGGWNWNSIRTINYFFENVLSKHEAGEISGDVNQLNHNIGEMYFFRAYEYFKHLKKIGDSPIILETIPDQLEPLLEASVRQPRHLVARQILKDLDLAIELLQDNPIGSSNRISKNVAWLFKSRVALYEGSWELNFKGTAFVPNGDGWPGKTAHPDLQYNADEEINFFLDQAIEASDVIAKSIPLTENPASYDYTKNDGSGKNPYFEMFATVGSGLKSVEEVLLFKAYDMSLSISHNMVVYIHLLEDATGYNNQLMKNFLMANGLPIYAPDSNYKGDREIKDMKEGRDNRLQLFVQAPGEILNNANLKVKDAPNIISGLKVSTGYKIKKRAAIEANQWLGGYSGTIGDIIFRAAEAHLNYIEAYYLRHGSLGGNSDTYWRAIRKRANVDENYMNTVNATIMSEEAEVDLAAYTAGELLTDKVLYNIRRERRSEFIAEGFRMDDLKRYRALDQLISERVFIPQGFNLWDYYHTVKTPEYFNDKGESNLVQTPDAKANVSKNEDFVSVSGETLEGKYLYPFRLRTNNLYYDGYKFAAAHYLAPIGAVDIMDAATSGSPEDIIIENSAVYQNPGWGTTVGKGALDIQGFN